jgi:hypothetical protein
VAAKKSAQRERVEFTYMQRWAPTMSLKRVCHEIFWVLIWNVWIDLGLYKNCSLSLWRAVRGSKLMRLELIHGLFIT